MTITDFTALGFEPVATKLHPPIDGVWGSTIFKRRRKDFHYSYYVASIHVREKSMLYGQPIPVRKKQAEVVYKVITKGKRIQARSMGILSRRRGACVRDANKRQGIPV